MNGTSIYKFLAVLNQQKILGQVCSRWVPLFYQQLILCFICSFSFYYHLLLLLLLFFICLRVGVISAGCRTVAILDCFARPPRVEVLFILIHCGHWSDLTCFSIDYRMIISFLAKKKYLKYFLRCLKSVSPDLEQELGL